MQAEELNQNYPTLYHMAESGSWPKIQRYGLLSTSALLDMFEINGEDRIPIESQQRKDNVILKHPIYGSVTIRDQKVLHENTLKRLLVDMSPRQYYEKLNGMSFFWVRQERLQRLLGAKAYRDRSHSVLSVDTSALVRAHASEISLTHINSGATSRGSGRRGTGTFVRIVDYPFAKMKRQRRLDAVVELSVDYAVKDIEKFTLRVEEWRGNNAVRTIWEKGKS
jgi:hypothetical protein